MERVRLWTDGCCLSAPVGPGGWAYVVEYHGREIDSEAGGTAETTDGNRMELAAVAQALLYPTLLPIEIVTDSHYVLYYAAKGGRGPGGARNGDLLTEINRLFGGRQVSFTRVKGHRHPFNERADALAKDSARKARIRRRDLRRRSPQSATSPSASIPTAL